MKRIIAMLTAVIMALLMVPFTAKAASENITMSVSADKGMVNPGDTVNFSVSIGAVNSLGGLEFYLDIPEGMTIDDTSIVIPDGLAEVLDSDGDIVVPASKNTYKWSYSVASTGYAGSADLVILTFACRVNDDSVFEEKSVGIIVETCFDTAANCNEHVVSVVPAKVTVEKAKVAVSSVSLDKIALTLKDGETAVLTATVAPEDADNKTVTWTSDNTDVATVENGTVTAIKAGTANISVSTEDGNKTASCAVTVTCNHELTKTEAVAPTCGKDGNIEYYTCSKCSKMFDDDTAGTEITDVVDKATGNHGETEVKNAVAATEEKEGYTGDTYCKVCGNKIATGTTISKLPHTHAMSKTDAVAATCEKDGNVEYYTCSKCGKNYADQAGTKELTSVVEKATGHKAGTEWKTDEANHWKVCTVCTSEVDKAEHSYTWVVDKAATEDETGLKHEECTCGVKRNENTEIAKLDHVHVGITHYDAVAATCIKEGNLEYWTCASEKCAGKYFGDKDCQLEITEIVVAKNPENHVSDGAWEVDAEKHAYICVCGSKTIEENHGYDDVTDANCNVCDYKRYYTVVEGSNSVIEQDSQGDLTFKVDGELSLFDTLKIDGTVVAAEHYTLAEGSTIITLKNSFVNSLAVGNHSVEVLYSDGKIAMTSFEIKEDDDDDDDTPTINNNAGTSTENTEVTKSPKTGDEYSVWGMLAMMVVVGAVSVAASKKNRDKL